MFVIFLPLLMRGVVMAPWLGPWDSQSRGLRFESARSGMHYRGFPVAATCWRKEETNKNKPKPTGASIHISDWGGGGGLGGGGEAKFRKMSQFSARFARKFTI